MNVTVVPISKFRCLCHRPRDRRRHNTAFGNYFNRHPYTNLVCIINSALSLRHWPHDDYVPKRKNLKRGTERYLGRAAVIPSRHSGTPHRSISPSHRWPSRCRNERKFAHPTERTRTPWRGYYQAVCAFSLLIFWPRLTEHRLSPEVEWPVSRGSSM